MGQSRSAALFGAPRQGENNFYESGYERFDNLYTSPSTTIDNNKRATTHFSRQQFSTVVGNASETNARAIQLFYRDYPRRNASAR
jgi:hypothetical protein